MCVAVSDGLASTIDARRTTMHAPWYDTNVQKSAADTNMCPDKQCVRTCIPSKKIKQYVYAFVLSRPGFIAPFFFKILCQY